MRNEEHENKLSCQLPNINVAESFSRGKKVLPEIKQMWSDCQDQLVDYKNYLN